MGKEDTERRDFFTSQLDDGIALLRRLVDGYEMAGDEFYDVICDYCSLQTMNRDEPHDDDCPWLAAKRYLEGQDA